MKTAVEQLIERIDNEVDSLKTLHGAEIRGRMIGLAFAKRVALELKEKYKEVNRVEVIQHSDPYNGRAYVNYNAKDVDIQIQDEGRTLKVFLK